MPVGFKVVYGDKSFSPATPKALQRIRYHIGEWTVQDEPNHGPFAVFKNLRSAQSFLIRGYGEIILLVEYKKSTIDYLWKKGPPTFKKNKYGNSPYYAVKTEKIVMSVYECPPGTVLASAVKPIATVPDDIREDNINIFLCEHLPPDGCNLL